MAIIYSYPHATVTAADNLLGTQYDVDGLPTKSFSVQDLLNLTVSEITPALNLKANIASPTFTGTVNGVDAIFSGSVEAAAFNVTSDKRLKTDIKSLSNAVEAIMKLNPVTYKKKTTLSSQDYLIKEYGFIAQELQKVMPILVQEGADANKILTVNYISIIPVLTKAIQEQQKQIGDQQKQINDLKALVEKLINKK
jgi:hypothetical protein